jgi:outer membrane receptor protein involved in Fe transport
MNTVAVATQSVRYEASIRASVQRELRRQPIAALCAAAILAPLPSMAAESASTENADSASSAASSDPILAEVVVTSQKREERLQDVPISVTALNGAVLDAQPVGGVSDALMNVPGVSIASTPQGGATQVTIRGVASGAAAFNGASTAAYYIDSVPFGFVKHAIVPDTNAYDMQRIEVLRGPQGTLYGANALNGVVRLLTSDADLSRFDFKGRVGTATTKNGAASYRGDLAVNVPLVEDKLAIRLVGGYEDAGGWIDQPVAHSRDVNDTRSRSFRAKLNAQPTDELNIKLSAWISRVDQGTANYSDDHRDQSAPFRLPQSMDFDAYNATVSYQFPGFSVSSATSYLDFSNTSNRDYTALFPDLVLYTDFGTSVFSEELLVNSTNDGNWRWSGGAFYRDAKDVLYQELGVFIPAPIDLGDNSDSHAIFGELTRKMFDGKIELTGGVRYFKDKVTQIERTPQSGTPDDVLIHRSGTFDAVTSRAVVTWLPSEDRTFYASFSQGFRSGFNQEPAVIRSEPGIPPVEADRLNNYELGAKGDLFDRKLSFDAALYYLDWKDIQQNINVTINGILYASTVNGPSASGFGVDLGLTARPTTDLKMGITFSWNDLTLDDPTITQTAAGPVTLFEKGSRIAFSPEYNASAFIDYSFPFGANGYRTELSAAGVYSSAINAHLLIAGAAQFFESEAPVTARVRAALVAPQNWTLALYCENLTDYDRIVQPPIDTARRFRLRPRTVGLQFEYHL